MDERDSSRSARCRTPSLSPCAPPITSTHSGVPATMCCSSNPARPGGGQPSAALIQDDDEGSAGDAGQQLLALGNDRPRQVAATDCLLFLEFLDRQRQIAPHPLCEQRAAFAQVGFTQPADAEEPEFQRSCLRRRGKFRRQRHLEGVAPQAVEIVKLADRFLKDMHHDVAIVDQGPASFVHPFDAERPHAMLLLQAEVNRLGRSLHLAVGTAGGQHDEVGQ